MNGLTRMKKFHQARWNEPIIYELSEPGQRGVLVPGPVAANAHPKRRSLRLFPNTW